MSDPTNNPNDESKKDTVRINLPPGAMAQAAAAKQDATKRDTSAITGDPAKKETAMMGSPAAAKKETSRVAVPVTSVASDMPRPTVRLRREPVGATPGAPRAAAPEMPRPTVKLKVEEIPVTSATAAPSSMGSAAAPVTVEGGVGGLDAFLALAAAACSIAVLVYLVM
jgi:hypothetical protein